MRRLDHRTNALSTNRLTDRQTKDTVSYRGALVHLKTRPSRQACIRSNGLEMGKKIKSLKKRKKEFFEDLTLLAVPIGKM